MERMKIPLNIRTQILHEAAYQCSNPICRSLVTLDIHHIEKVTEGGTNTPENLIALCPTCHRRHHDGEIPIETLKSWKYHLLALNEAFDKKSINYLLLLNKIKSLFLRSEGLLEFASLIASGNVVFEESNSPESIEVNYFKSQAIPIVAKGFSISLSSKGKALVYNWINGNQVTLEESDHNNY